MLKVLSLGAGVQSSTVLLASEKGLLPRLDAAIFADTGWEPAHVYQHLEWLIDQVSIPVYQVQAGNIHDDMIEARTKGAEYNGRWAAMPLFVRGDDIDGMIRRQCTKEYKIEPVTRQIRRLLGKESKEKIAPNSVQQWFGISTDEVRRARLSDRKYIENHYPLILDLKWSRSDCQAWLEKEFPGYTVPKSACIGCPYHSDAQWLEMKRLQPNEFQQAVEFDKKIRLASDMIAESYLHSSCKPLDQVDFNEDQQDLFGQDCMGMCGV